MSRGFRPANSIAEVQIPGAITVKGATDQATSGLDEQLILSADRPISGRAEDRLGRGPFASRLATAIASWKGQESLVIGLYGSWGSGKSSVKNLVLENLAEQRAVFPQVLEFNPWQWRGHDEVSAAFFREILQKIGSAADTSKARRLVKALRRYAKSLGVGGAVLDVLRYGLGAVLAIVGLLALGLPSVVPSYAAKALAQGIGVTVLAFGVLLVSGERLLDRFALWVEAKFEIDTQSLEEQKQAVTRELRGYGKPLLVVIDDLDRLSPREIRTVFQLIKANADFPGFVYLVLFQRSSVEQALKDEVNSDGAKYVEKIVQVAFDLPQIQQEQIDVILFEGLDTLLGRTGAQLDQTYWGNVYVGALRQYFSNLRLVKRFLSVLGFHLGLLRVGEILEVNPVDLIALETLGLFEPAFFQSLSERKTLLTGRLGLGNDDLPQLRQECQDLLKLVSEEYREGITTLMRELFPSVAHGFGGMRHGSDFYETWLRELRVCSPEFFDRYFQYSLSPKDVSQAEVNRLINLSANGKALTAELKRLAADGKLMTALERLEVRMDAINQADIADVLIALFNIGSVLPERILGFFDLPPEWTLMRIATKLLLREQNADMREAALERALRETENFSMAVIRVARDSDSESRKKNPESLVLREESLPRFQALCLERIRSAAAEGKMHSQPDLAHLLFRWKEWAGPEEVRKWVSGQISSREGAISFLRPFLHSGTTHTAGDQVAKIHWFIKLSEIENFADSEQLERILADVSLVELAERDRLAVEEFRKALARKRAGKTEGKLGWDGD